MARHVHAPLARRLDRLSGGGPAGREEACGFHPYAAGREQAAQEISRERTAADIALTDDQDLRRGRVLPDAIGRRASPQRVQEALGGLSGVSEQSAHGDLRSQRSGLNRRPPDYESGALPLSYAGEATRPRSPTMPWRGLEPRRLAAPPPQDGVSTSFTTRALLANSTGPTGLEPATSRVTVECSNQTELRPHNWKLRSSAGRRPSR